MAALVVPCGSALEARSATYGKPTPWQATRADPYVLFRALQVAGPTVEPYECHGQLINSADDIGRGTYQVAGFGRTSRKDKGDVAAGAIGQLVGGAANTLALLNAWVVLVKGDWMVDFRRRRDRNRGGQYG